MSQSTNTDYYDLITTGRGKLQRIRQVPVGRAKPFWAATAVHYPSSVSAKEARIDCRLCGDQPIAFIEDLQVPSQASGKLVDFTIGSLYPDSFYPTKVEEESEPELIPLLKGRLINITLAETTEPAPLVTRGLGYLQAVKQTGKSDAWWIRLSAFHGLAGSVEYVPFHCTANDPDVVSRLEVLQPSLMTDEKVLVGFTLHNLTPSLFHHQSGKRQNDIDPIINAELVEIRWAKVNGESVFGEPASLEAVSNDSASADKAESTISELGQLLKG